MTMKNILVTNDTRSAVRNITWDRGGDDKDRGKGGKS